MVKRTKQFGMTLTEMVLVIAAVAVMAALAVPAVDALLKGFESEGQTKAMISSALASARANAMKHRRYAGIRFQKAYNPDHSTDYSKWQQYMIPIIHDYQATGLSGGFRALPGAQPIRMPRSMEVMDLRLGDSDSTPSNFGDGSSDFLDTTSFSIVFSPSGRLVVRDVRIAEANQYDDIFNTSTRVEENGEAMFHMDGQIGGLQEEPSRQFLIIYNKSRFYNLPAGQRYDDYLRELDDNRRYYVNPHLGRLIKPQD